MSMSARVVDRAWSWRSFVWAGVIASVLAWAWAWFRVGGVTAVMVLVAVAAIVFAMRGTAGMRLALVGLMIAGLTMLLASIYMMYTLLLAGNQAVNTVDVITVALFPLVAAIVLLLGATSGFRHASS
jgi:hypothetical protein